MKNYAERILIVPANVLSVRNSFPDLIFILKLRNDMPQYQKYFVRTLTSLYGEIAPLILSELDATNVIVSKDIAFAATSTNPVDRRLDFCACFLSLIIVLDRRHENFENIRRLCLDITTDYVKPKNMLQAMMKRIPPKLTNTWIGRILLKSFRKKIGNKGHPDGFLAEMITDKKETYGLGYGINILECGICKLFKKYDYEKYASILCEVDEITSGLAGLRLIRHGTIARGAHICDFRYEKISSK